MSDKTLRSLSSEQQRALFLSERNLALFSAGLKGLLKPDRFGNLIQSEVSPEVAEWALPHAKLIREAEDKYGEGRISEALNEFQRIQRILPDAAIVMMNMGVCYAEIGDRATASFWLERALKVVPTERKELVQENLRRLQNR